ncbi:TonB-dependent hemoglobin/transferrin/lactoferrin family receptor [Psychrobium sp. MM17-31]|uniref:TonB-dependent hemoglobin/transferrin/lactoferrin family receptor n=1 Tax=Psychrobium sp. MM17-31 TaxID=2917758 RepID=UPI001EF549BB|nr:TonB-dependent hemoglobin/transferrin/lactoferrin family receptor [Psychrobium sp. MM17-31]MCG7529867.1 TonB-dependent hemoglobin/transferrin/lactoferrin family receptor [Psychrobium sp. MM17-31]
MLKTTPTLLAVTIGLLVAQPSLAETELQKTTVKGDKANKVATQKKTITAKDIDKEMQGDIYDAARYMAGVEVANTGNRFGANGFNIRGMEGDAVAITVDGLSQGESLDPPNFSRYGMFSSTRNGVDPEAMKTITIVKGANSVTAGSGALGGAVMYVTKDAKDFLNDDADAFGGNVKIGYDGRSKEQLASVSLAKRFGDFEALAILTSREGNEYQAHSDGADITGNARGITDPLDKSQTNVLVKLNYQLNEAMNIGLVFEDYNKNDQGQSLSRESASYSNFRFDDDSERQRFGVVFNWQANNALFDDLDIKFNNQEVFTSGVTIFDYTSQGNSYLRTEDRNYKQDMTNVTFDFGKIIANGDITHNLVYGLAHTSSEVVNSLQDIRYNGLTKDSGLRDGYPIIDPSWVPKTDSTTTTLYLRDTIDVSEQLALKAGVRWDKTKYEPTVDDTFTDTTGNAVSDSDFDSATVQLGAQYQFNQHHGIDASISTGYKAPTTQQLYLNTNGTGQFSDVARVVDPTTGSVSYAPSGRTETDLDSVTNPNLEAEKGLNLELTYRFTSEKFDLAVTAFSSKYDNLIIDEVQSNTFDTPLTTASFNWFIPSCNAPVRTDACYTVSSVTGDTWTKPVNGGEISVSGFEVDARWHISRQLDMRFSYAHTDGEYDNGDNKGDKLESITPDTAIVGLDYLADNQQWGLGAMARFIAKKDKEDSYQATFYSDSATVVDLTAFYNITDDLTVRGGIYNAFDENYSLWNAVRNVRPGSGGFFGGVDYDEDTGVSQGIARYSQPGREFVVNLNYRF